MSRFDSISIASLHDDLKGRMAALRADHGAVTRSRDVLDSVIATGGVFYGINTGFGKLASRSIPNESLRALQRNLVLSHAVGVGDPVPKSIARVMLQLKIHALSLGFSGVSPSTFERLLTFAERDLIPVIPSKGSVGASGDLAPLAHMALPLLGHGAFWDNSDKNGNTDGQVQRPASDVLEEEGLAPIVLEAKDGLSLLNGTQLMSGYGAFILNRSLAIERMADVIASMSLEALQGSIRPFDERVHALRPHTGQKRVARNVRLLLGGSEILDAHRDCGKVQDPYCLRCVPQVHGASRDALAYGRSVLETEVNSVTDNPLVFENGDIVSGGNFHGQPVALALDFAAIALAELASISERRTYLLLEGHDGLPTLLMRETGLNSGFMIPQYTAAALVSENKILCHPASVDSIPTSLGQEDHVSMGATAAVKLLTVLHNVENVLAIELITAAQALDYRKPLGPGKGVQRAHEVVRHHLPHREADYFFQDDLKPAVRLVRGTELLDVVADLLGPLA